MWNEEVMLRHSLPKGVFSEVYGLGDVGWKLVQENINLILFTGSSAIGQKLYRLAGEDIKNQALDVNMVRLASEN